MREAIPILIRGRLLLLEIFLSAEMGITIWTPEH
jgi:hypothetical protein